MDFSTAEIVSSSDDPGTAEVITGATVVLCKVEDEKQIINYQWQYQSNSGKWHNYNYNNNWDINVAWHNSQPYITINNNYGTP